MVPSGVTEPLVLALYAAPELWAPVWLLCCFLRTEYFPELNLYPCHLKAHWTQIPGNSSCPLDNLIRGLDKL